MADAPPDDVAARVKAVAETPVDRVHVARHRDLLALVARLADSNDPLPDLARTLLKDLRSARAYDRLHLAASEMAYRGFISPFSNRMKVQALIEHERYAEALQEIARARSDHGEDRAEMAELAGLEGRVYKQLFVQSRTAGRADGSALSHAIEAYERGWTLTGRASAWHGANLAALLKLGQRVGLDTGREADVDALARSVMQAVEREREQYPDEAWPHASAGEAALALGQYEEAVAAYARYVEHKKATAFALTGTHRQLRDIWLSEGPPKLLQAIYDRLTEALLTIPEGRIEFRQGEMQTMAERLQKKGYEALFGKRPVSIQWAQRMADVGKCVGRIDRRGPLGEPAGTGFLIEASLLCEAWAPYHAVLVTNEHVVSAYGTGQLRIEDAVVRFTQGDSLAPVPLGKVLWCSRAEDHDVTILTLGQPTHEMPRLLETAPLDSIKGEQPDEFQPVTVLGHPAGSERPHLAIENLDVVQMERSRSDGEPERVWYRCPTARGSSGSPVLTWRQLEATAVHHRAIDARNCNEGVSLNSVRAAIQLRPEGWNGPMAPT